MKKSLVIILLLTLIVGNRECFAQNIWTKIDIGATEDLQKAIIFNGKTLIFSANNCYINDHDIWEKVKIPKSNYPCPVIFKDSVYLNTTSGIYKSLDGRKWDKVTSLSALSLAANKKKIFAFTSDPFHIAFESQDAINFQEIAGIQNLYPAPSRDAGLYNPRFTFAEAFGDTIYASGYASLGPAERTCKSLDGGISWEEEDISEIITDIELVTYRGSRKLTMTKINHSWRIFLANGYFSQPGGVFFTLDNFKGVNFYFGGQTTSGRGVIMEDQSIGNIFYTPAPINCLKSNNDFIIAVGNKGYVYIMYNPDIISDMPQLDTKEDFIIFLDGGVLSITTVPNEPITIVDLNGKCVKSLLATEGESAIDISNLNSGCYVIKAGYKSAKFMKK